MDENQVIQAVKDINVYLQQELWFDFEVMEYRGDTLIVMGNLDTSAPHDIEICFQGVAFVSLPMEWRTDTSAPPLSLMTSDDARPLNLKFQVERGHHIFRFVPEGFLDNFGCLIGARKISYRLTKHVARKKG